MPCKDVAALCPHMPHGNSWGREGKCVFRPQCCLTHLHAAGADGKAQQLARRKRLARGGGGLRRLSRQHHRLLVARHQRPVLPVLQHHLLRITQGTVWVCGYRLHRIFTLWLMQCCRLL